MPRTSIAVEEIPWMGNDNDVTFNAVDAANGMMFPNDGKTIPIVRNADAASKTVTVRAVADPFGRSVDMAITVAAGKTAIVGPLPPVAWNQKSGADIGQVYIDFSAATSTTIALVRVNI